MTPAQFDVLRALSPEWQSKDEIGAKCQPGRGVLNVIRKLHGKSLLRKQARPDGYVYRITEAGAKLQAFVLKMDELHAESVRRGEKVTFGDAKEKL